jgi:predicted RNA-binding Zn-ribbon protein involved in translation (DUF1610 family)
MSKPKILFLDIETAPIDAYVWSLWNNFLSIDHISADWYVLCYSAKWQGSKDTLYDALPRYKEAFEKDMENDYNVLLTARDLLDEADIVVAHNGKKFDIPKLNARFLLHGIPPPSPFRIVDTLKAAKRSFKLTSNKLDYIARYLGIGSKIKNDGINLWRGCKRGDKKSWKEMIEYNIMDVALLEKVYNRLLPWIEDHPNVNVFKEDLPKACPKCGSEHIQSRGYYTTNVGKFRRYVCNDCGGWSKERYSDLTKDQRKRILSNATTNN